MAQKESKDQRLKKRANALKDNMRRRKDKQKELRNHDTSERKKDS